MNIFLFHIKKNSSVIFLLFIIISSLLVSCSDKPTYNPFDGQWNVTREQVVKDSCKFGGVSGGVYNMYVDTGRFQPYYQFELIHEDMGESRSSKSHMVNYEEDDAKLVGKGFTYYIDTFPLVEVPYPESEVIYDSIIKLPMNESLFNSYLVKYGYYIERPHPEYLYMISNDKLDTNILSLMIDVDEREHGEIRFVSYYINKNRYFSKKKI